MRSLVNRGFTPRRIAALEPRDPRDRARRARRRREQGRARSGPRLLDPAARDGDRRDARRRAASGTPTSSAGPTASSRASRARRLACAPRACCDAFKELSDYMTGVIDARRAQPREDLISTLTRAEVGETALTPVEILMFTLLLLVGRQRDHDQPARQHAARAARASGRARARAARPGADSGARRGGRCASMAPVQLLFRRATQDLELAGTRIPAGATVMPLIGSANRDDAQFPDPDRLDATRNPQATSASASASTSASAPRSRASRRASRSRSCSGASRRFERDAAERRVHRLVPAARPRRACRCASRSRSRAGPAPALVCAQPAA